MSYDLVFLEEALKEWKKLGATIKTQFQNKLKERLENSEVEALRLSGTNNRYKIKLRTVGYRLVYEVRDKTISVIVIAVGKRERNAVYMNAVKRI